MQSRSESSPQLVRSPARRLTICAALLALLTASAAGQTRFPFDEIFQADAAQRWKPFAGKWEFSPLGARQTDTAFDCGAAVAVRPEGPYWLSVRFRPESNFTGAGLFFALPSTERKNGGMLIRCDPEDRIIWGRFDEGGTFQFANEAIYDDDGDREQELAIAVDPAKGALNLYHHGERIATNIRVPATQGFVGITCSGGPHTFLDFECRPASAAELEGLKEPSIYSRIVDVIGDEHQVVALRQGPELLTAYDASGAPRRSASSRNLPGLRPISDEVHAVALAWNVAKGDTGTRDILALIDGGKTIYVFNSELEPLGADGPFYHDGGMQGTALCVDADGRIFIADASIPGIRVLDRDGRVLVKFGEKGNVVAHDRSDPKSAGKFKNPRGIAVRPAIRPTVRPTGGRSPNEAVEIVVTDRENYTFVVYRFDPEKKTFEFVRNGPWMPLPGQVFFDSRGKMAMAGTFEYYRAYGALRVMHFGSGDDPLCGTGEKIFLAHGLRDLSDKVRACEGPAGPDGEPRYYVADPDKDRFLILPMDFVEPLPRFGFLPDGRVQLTVTKVAGTEITTFSEPIRTPSASEGPMPAKRIVVNQREPVCECWPPAGLDDMTTYKLPPAPGHKKVYVIDLPVLVAVFTQANNADAKDEKDEKEKHLDLRDHNTDPQAVIARLKRELAPARDFYWRVSRGTLNVQFDYIVVDDPAAVVDGGWIQPALARKLVNKARAQAGLAPIDKHHSLIGIHPMGGFDPDFTDDPGTVSGGGLTPYAYSGYGLWNHGQGWLFGHEWGHQLDAYFEKSGFPDWWLNHPDGTVHIGRYGEHWDCNAFLCRRADKPNWLRLKFGTLRAVDDADGDGLADADSTLPLDEARFGSDPRKPDTDEDGLDDLAELCAGTFSSSDPLKEDADGDGVPDDKDTFPQFAIHTAIGSPERSDVGPLGTIRSAWADAALHGSYDADALHVAFILSKPARNVLVPVDWNDDGWFVGHDNVYYSADLEWPESGPPKLRQAHGCEARLQQTDDGRTEVLLTLKRPATREPLKADERVSICPRVENGGGRVAFLADPWQLIALELK
ncbi:MAG: hypothetical protein AB1716_00015 [Planctomycetota bacterium]